MCMMTIGIWNDSVRKENHKKVQCCYPKLSTLKSPIHIFSINTKNK